MISLIVLTHNRVDLLRRCVENVLERTSAATRDIVIWDNASSDGTRGYLATLEDPRIRVVHHPRNIGQNAYAEAVALTSESYLIELDDDVTDAPEHWDATLLDAYRRLPTIGFLSANLVDDPNDEASYLMHHIRQDLYRSVEENGVRLLKEGPTGGGCAMTSRELYERVGGFRQERRQVFWLEDQAYIQDIHRLGYEAAFLEDLRVHHTGGRFYASQSAEKARYWERFDRRVRRRTTVKRALLHLPLVGELNQRYRWFQAPDSS